MPVQVHLKATMKIGEFARQFGLTPATVRYYESLGLLERAPRIAGSRSYGQHAHASLRIVLALKHVGFSLGQIRTLRALGIGGSAPERWRELARTKLAQIDQDIANLQAARAALTESLACECDAKVANCALLTNTAIAGAWARP
jgi:DNA-binding transcriptional MerR regulator